MNALTHQPRPYRSVTDTFIFTLIASMILTSVFAAGVWCGCHISELPANDRQVLDLYHAAQAGNPYGGK